MLLEREFYNRDSVVVAQELLGKILVRNTEHGSIYARIVETESYMGIIDKAAHSYGGKRTPRVEIMYGQAGYSYVYLIYGMYHCLNVVTNQVNIPQAVLIRAVEPIGKSDYIAMSQNKYKMPYDDLTRQQKKNLTSGPGKLCLSYGIDKSHNGIDLCSNNSSLYIENSDDDSFEVVISKRIGIDYAEEDAHRPWRFYIKGNSCVSVL